MLKQSRALLALLAVLTVLAAGCSGDSTTETEEPAGTSPPPGRSPPPESLPPVVTPSCASLEGSINVSGSSTVQPITQAVAEEFNALAPNVATTVDGPGTGDGFELFCGGQTDISDASRPISEEEIAACEASGTEFIELRVAIDGIAVMTSAENSDLTCLSFGDLYSLIGPESTGTAMWSDNDALAAELDGVAGVTNSPFPAAPLVITGPGEESGTFDSFVDIVFGDIAEERGQDVTTRPDYQASPNDNVIIEGIGGNPSSLGWVGFAFAEDAGDAVTELEIDGGDGCVAPTAETIADSSYPISRDLWVYVSATTWSPTRRWARSSTTTSPPRAWPTSPRPATSTSPRTASRRPLTCGRPARPASASAPTTRPRLAGTWPGIGRHTVACCARSHPIRSTSWLTWRSHPAGP